MLMTLDGKLVGRRVRALREATDPRMSQQDLASAADLTLSALFRLEKGRTTDPRLSTIVRLAAALDVAVDELIREEKP